MIYPATEIHPGTEIAQITETLNIGESVELIVAGETLDGDFRSKTVRLPFDDTALTAAERIQSMGLTLKQVNNRMIVDMIEFGSPAEASGIDFDWEIRSVVVDSDRPMKEWVFLPALLLVIALAWNQKRRIRTQEIRA